MTARALAVVLLLLILVLLGSFALLSLWDVGSGPTQPGAARDGDPTAAAEADRKPTQPLQGEAGGPAAADEKGDTPSEQRRALSRDALAAGSLVPLTGQLTYQDGSPAPGLDLNFTLLPDTYPGSGDPGDLRDLARLLPRPKKRMPKESLETYAGRSGQDGRFSLGVKPARSGNLTLGGDLAVLAEGGRSGKLVEVPAEGRDLGRIEVLRAASILGQVLERGGAAAAGVELRPQRVSQEERLPGFGLLMRPPGGSRAVSTDEQGRFAIRGLRPGEYSLETQSPKHLPAKKVVALTEGQQLENLLIELRPGGQISGRVVDDLGRPLEGAKVASARTQDLGEGMKMEAFPEGESTLSDASGEFELGGLEGATASLRITKQGHAPFEQKGLPVGSTGLVLPLERLGSVAGTLVDEKGRPIQGSRVQASAQAGGLLRRLLDRSATTDAEGRFLIAEVTPGRVTLRATGKGHLPSAEQAVEVRPGERSEGIQISARTGTTLSVLVRDSRQLPVSEAEVSVFSKPDPDSSFSFQTSTRHAPGVQQRRMVRRQVRRDASGTDVRILGAGGDLLGRGRTGPDGKVEITGLPAGQVLVKAKHEGLALTRPSELLLPEAGDAKTELAMQQGGLLQVSAVDISGKPVAHARFAVLGPIQGTEEPERDSQAANDQGLARVGPLPPGSYEAVLEAEARPENMGGVSVVMAGMNADIQDSRVAFSIKEGEVSEIKLVRPIFTKVSGTVRDASGPVTNAVVELTKDGSIRLPIGGSYKSKTDTDGKYALEGVPSGKYSLSYGRPKAVVRSEKEISLAKNQPDHVEHLLIPGGTLKLTVHDDEEGLPIEDAKVSLKRLSDRSNTPASGRQTTRRQTRMMMIGVQADSGGSGSPTTFSISSGQASMKTDELGKVVIEEIPQGKYELVIEHPDSETHTREIELGQNQILDLGLIRLKAGGRVRGEIAFEQPGELSMAEVEIRRVVGKQEKGEAPQRTIAQDQTFRFTGLRAGKYEVRARSLGGGGTGADWSFWKAVEVKVGRTVRVDLEVPKAK